MAERKVLAKPVYLDDKLIPAGTELTDEQAERITNPKAFQDDPTFADKVKAAKIVYEQALADAATAEAEQPVKSDAVKDDRTETGAALAHAAKEAAPKGAAAKR